MKRIALLLIVATPLSAQVSQILPDFAKASLAQGDRDSAIVSARQLSLDSLAAGRRRWTLAAIQDYVFQVHSECFCIGGPETDSTKALAVVHGGRVVARAPGKKVGGAYYHPFTIDSLFVHIDNDIRDTGRKVTRLDLDRLYGFPRRYEAATRGISDLEITIVIDSFAVTRPPAKKP